MTAKGVAISGPGRARPPAAAFALRCRSAKASGSAALHMLARALIGLTDVAGSRQIGHCGTAPAGRIVSVPPGTWMRFVTFESAMPS